MSFDSSAFLYRVDESNLNLLDYETLDTIPRMGAFDVYCAICGGPFKLDPQFLSSLSTTSASSPNTPAAPDHPPHSPTQQTPISTSWLPSLRLLGRNLSTGHAYITGKGSIEDFGWALVERGEDANVPDARAAGVVRRADEEGREVLGLPCYFDWSAMGDAGGGAGMPVHEGCWGVLGEAWGVRRDLGNGVVDVGEVRGVMEGLMKGCANLLGGMEYFEFRPGVGGETVWDEGVEGLEGREVLLCDPARAIKVEIPMLETMRKTNLEVEEGEVEVQPSRAAETGDAFEKLPTELLLQTLNQLSGREVLELYKASASVRARCDNRFWKWRMRRDMPWLHRLHDEACAVDFEGREVDWERLFRWMLGESYPEAESSLSEEEDAKGGAVMGTVLGVASRRRIWHCCDQILDRCEEVRAEKERRGRQRAVSRVQRL